MKNKPESVETHLRLGGERDLERLLDCDRERLTLRALLRLLEGLLHRHPAQTHRRKGKGYQHILKTTGTHTTHTIDIQKRNTPNKHKHNRVQTGNG